MFSCCSTSLNILWKKQIAERYRGAGGEDSFLSIWKILYRKSIHGLPKMIRIFLIYVVSLSLPYSICLFLFLSFYLSSTLCPLCRFEANSWHTIWRTNEKWKLCGHCMNVYTRSHVRATHILSTNYWHVYFRFIFFPISNFVWWI